MSALSPPVALEAAAVRIVLFGMPDAGKSSLLGALAQAAHTQGRALHGHLTDLSHGLGELRNKLYEDRQTETQQEIVPYPVRFAPYGRPAIPFTVYDCDGRAANELLTQKRSLEKEARPGTLAGAILSADALILTVDASAPPTQVEDDFREFLRFLRFLERHRSQEHAVGGLPVYLVLTKCDKLAPDGTIARDIWEARIAARRADVAARFKQFLAGAGVRDGQFTFGSIDLDVRATAVRRPALTDAAPQSKEPAGVAELFHEAFQEASAFRHRRERSHKRLVWTVAGAAGLVGAMAVAGAVFLVVPNRPAETTLADRVEALRASEGPDARTRLGPGLDRRMREWREVQADPGFADLPDALKELVRARLEEGGEYIQFRDALAEVPPPNRARSLADLAATEARLQRVAPPPDYQREWGPTEAVQQRDRLLTKDIPALREAVGRLTQFYYTLRNRAGALLQAAEVTPAWGQEVRNLEEAPRPPFPKTDPALGTAYDFDEVAVAVADWEKAHDRLTRVRQIVRAVGLFGDAPAGDQAPLAPATVPPTDPAGILQDAAQRWQNLKTSYPDSAKWSLAAVPDSLRPEVEKQLRRSIDQFVGAWQRHVVGAGQRLILAKLRALIPGDQEVPSDWPKVGDYLLSPPLADWRALTAYLARLADPTAPDPVETTAAFLKRTAFELDPRELRVRIPDTLSTPPVSPAGDLVLVHRPADGGAETRLALSMLKNKDGTDKKPVRDGQSLVYTFVRSGPAVTYRPGDTFFARLPVRKDRQDLRLTWVPARTAAFQFEALGREPRLHEPEQSNLDGQRAVGVTVTVTDGQFPAVPAMVPFVQFESK